MEVMYYPWWPFFAVRLPENHVRWVDTTEAHLFVADLPGCQKENIRVEVEDSTYMIIRTETETQATAETDAEGSRSFSRKFRLPERIDLEGISARFEDGVLTVTVPKRAVAFRLRLEPIEAAPSGGEVVARAA